MTVLSRLGKQIEELVSTLNSAGAPFALIGGLALAPYKVIRATQDVDLLTDAGMAETIHKALLALGYLAATDVDESRRTLAVQRWRCFPRTFRNST
jgi:hypothetical protein